MGKIKNILTEMIDNLIVGNEYSPTEIANIFNEPSIQNVKAGISYHKGITFLWPNLNQSFQNNRYRNVFVIEDRVYEWDSQDKQNINSPEIKALKDYKIPCLLFARMAPSRPYVYCGPITYKTHHEHTQNPVHLVFNLLEIDDDPSKSLEELYEWKPKDWNNTKKMWLEAPKAKAIFSDSPYKFIKKEQKENAVDIRAMEAVRVYFEEKDYKVKDVHLIEKYHCDYVCTKGNETRYIEVKGKCGYRGWRNVFMTDHEVDLAQNPDFTTDLYIVYDMELINIHKKSDKEHIGMVAKGGKLCIQENYNPNKNGNLRSLQYRYNPLHEDCTFIDEF